VGALRLISLGVRSYGLAVIFNMRLGRFSGVVLCVFLVTAGQVRMMRCCLVFSRFMMLCGFLVVSCRKLVMLCRLVMMLCCFL
jgi:hypothetical protein